MFFVVADELRAVCIVEERAGSFVFCPVAGDEEFFAIELAGVGVDVRIVFEQRDEFAVDDDFMLVAELDEFTIIVENGIGVIDFAGGIDFRVVRVDSNPGRTGREACVFARIPLHRRAGVVAGHIVKAGEHGFGAYAFLVDDELLPGVLFFDVAAVIDTRPVRIRHAEFFALIDIGRALHYVEAGREHFGRADAVFLRFVAAHRDAS